ncbi:unnamed protein product [Arctogadus glacialis]
MLTVVVPLLMRLRDHRTEGWIAPEVLRELHPTPRRGAAPLWRFTEASGQQSWQENSTLSHFMEDMHAATVFQDVSDRIGRNQGGGYVVRLETAGRAVVRTNWRMHISGLCRRI